MTDLATEGCDSHAKSLLKVVDLSFNHLRTIDIFSSFMHCEKITNLILSHNLIKVFYINEKILDTLSDIKHNKERSLAVSETFNL